MELSLEMSDFLLGSGLREIEKRVNAYWMTVTTDFNLTPNVLSYSITGSPISRTAFKEIYFASWRVNGTSKWSPLPHRSYELLNNQFDSSEAGEPRACAVDNVTLFIFPNPIKNYEVRLHSFEWTTLPADNVTAATEVMARFPEALLYGAAMVGTVLLTKSEESAKPWANLLNVQIPMIQKASDGRIKRVQ